MTTDERAINIQKVRERLEYDQNEIASKWYATQRLRDLADDEERDVLRMESQRSNLIDLLLNQAGGTPDYYELEALLIEFGVLPKPAAVLVPAQEDE